MAWYKVETRQSIWKTYRIEANSPDEAKMRYYRDAQAILLESRGPDQAEIIFCYEDEGLKYAMPDEGYAMADEGEVTNA
jgi:hypothetical protein